MAQVSLAAERRRLSGGRATAAEASSWQPTSHGNRAGPRYGDDVQRAALAGLHRPFDWPKLCVSSISIQSYCSGMQASVLGTF